MRKLICLFLLFAITVFSMAETTPRVATWMKIYGWKIAEIQPYVDTSTVKHEAKNGHDYATGMVLFYRQYPVEVTVQGNKYTVTSIARYYIVDCDQPMVVQILDFYFNTDRLPVVADAPVVAVDYRESKELPKEIPKEHALYKTFCPVYI